MLISVQMRLRREYSFPALSAIFCTIVITEGNPERELHDVGPRGRGYQSEMGTWKGRPLKHASYCTRCPTHGIVCLGQRDRRMDAVSVYIPLTFNRVSERGTN